MNIFKSIGIIVKAANDRYAAQKRTEDLQRMQQESLLNERRIKVLLRTQLEEIVEVMRQDSNLRALIIEIDEDCEPYLQEALEGLECEITPLSESHQYMIELEDDEL